MNKILLLLSVIAIICLASLPFSSSVQRNGLVWSDEFNDAAGTAPDPLKWGYDIGIGYNGWGNNELEYYTNRTANSYQDGNGNLVIKALKETFTGTDGITRFYTSARLVTRGVFEPKYGRVEARIKLPYGQGLWPAFWMLGNDVNSSGWPNCGEIDIMENIGKEPRVVHGSLHGPGYFGATPLTGTTSIPGPAILADDFHIFAVEWDPTEIRFYFDNTLYQTQNAATLNSNQRWVFDHPFYILMNVAVGGDWPGPPDGTTIFPQTMLVDYVRVYSRPRISQPANRRP